MEINDFRCMHRGKVLHKNYNIDAASLRAIEQRNGQKNTALLLVHGFSSSPAVFRNIIPAVTFYDAIMCPVLPGHGESIAAFAKVTASSWVTAIEYICEQLCAEYHQVDVLGLSLGGLLACGLATKFALRHLYLLAPALKLRMPITTILQIATCLSWLGFREVRNLAGDLINPQYGEIAYRKLPLSVMLEILKFIKQFIFTSPSCPTDLFLGRYDRVIASRQIVASFGNKENLTTHWLEHSAHVLPLDDDIEVIIQCIKSNHAKSY